MSNIKKLYSRLTQSMVKNRTLLFFIAIQNTIFTLLVLMYVNVIISNGKANGELNYQQIRFFYNAVMILLLLIPSISAPYFLAGSLNTMKKNSVIEYMLASKVKISEIIYAAYIRGLVVSIILLISSFPIACVSFYFGGVGIFRAIKFIIFLFAYAVFISSICIYISTCTNEANLSILIAYITLLIVFIIHVLYMILIIDKIFALFLYVFVSIVVSIFIVFLSSKSHIFVV